MLSTRGGELAIQAMLYLALQPPGKLSRARDIARDLKIPPAYLAKVLQALSRAGLVRAFKGPNGGLELGRTAGRIHLIEVVDATRGVPALDQCVLGFGQCPSEFRCPVHGSWWGIRQQIRKLLGRRTVGQLSCQIARRRKLPRAWQRTLSAVRKASVNGDGRASRRR